MRGVEKDLNRMLSGSVGWVQIVGNNCLGLLGLIIEELQDIA